MTHCLPPHLLAMFAARPPIPYAAPIEKRRNPAYTGVAAFVDAFESKAESDAFATALAAKPQPETAEQRRARRRESRIAANAARISDQLKLWDPNAPNPVLTTDPYKTLFIARMNYETTEQKLRREFETYGTIRTVRIVKDKEGRPRGYAFVEYENDRDMHAAYKVADGKKIDDRRVVVDAERGRTVRGWLPRRLGGGRGHARLSDEEKEKLRLREEEEERRREEERATRHRTSRHEEDEDSRHRHRHSSSHRHHEHDDRRYAPY